MNNNKNSDPTQISLLKSALRVAIAITAIISLEIWAIAHYSSIENYILAIMFVAAFVATLAIAVKVIFYTVILVIFVIASKNHN